MKYVDESGGITIINKADLTANADSTYTFTNNDGTDVIIDVDAVETLTTISIDANTGIITYLDEDHQTTDLDVGALVDSTETVTTLTDLGDGTVQYVDESGGITIINKADLTANADSTYTFTNNDGTDVIIDVDAVETLTTISIDANTGIITYLDEDHQTTDLDVGALVDSAETLTTLTDLGDGTVQYVDESGGITIINKADLTANADSTYTFTNNDGTDVIIDVDAVETLTTISIDANTGIITYLDEDHQTTDLDVGALVDSTETVTTLTDLGDGTIEYIDESGTSTIINKADLTANADSTYTFTNNDGTDVIIDVDAVETLTTISIDANTGIITYLDEDHQTTDLDVGALVDSAETLTTLTDLGDGTVQYVDESGGITIINKADLTANADSTYTFTNNDGTDVIIDVDAVETLTTISIDANTGIITYLDEDHQTTDLDVGALVDSTETVTTLTDLGDGTVQYVDESGGITIINKADLTANADSTYTFTNNDGTDVIIDVDAVETLTTISIDANTGIITYIDEDHQTTDLDVGALVDSAETVTTLTDWVTAQFNM